METMETEKRMRYHVLDNIRALNLISMILYHLSWDLVYLFGVDWKWYGTQGAYVWQQMICWTFILLSGFCWSMGHRRWKRGLEVFAAGLCVSIVTLLVMPEERVLFGILTLLGSCMLLMIPLEKGLRKVPAVSGFGISLIVFLLVRNVNTGWLGVEGLKFFRLPDGWYRNLITAYLGFPAPEFFSTDYFSLLPWGLLFISGYFLYRICMENGKMAFLTGRKISCLEFLGKHSLLIYMLHQPVIYLVLTLVMG